MRTFSAEGIRNYSVAVLTAEGVAEDCARDVADLLIDADLTGVSTHGVSRLAIYVQRVRAGLIAKERSVHVVRESPAALVIDAGNAFGAVGAKFAMERCIQKAGESGCCFAVVNHSNHFGAAAYYTRMAAEADMIGFACTNVTGKIAPHGSKTAFLGTNPFSVAAPSNGDPFLLDMTPTVVALGKLITAQKLGRSIPLGWALDEEGNPTTDPAKGRRGSLIPIGGPKGSGMAMAVDILAGILSGAGYSRYLHDLYTLDDPQGVGHFMGAIDISHFVDISAFKSMLSEYMDDIRHLEKADGAQEIRIPGQRGCEARRENLKRGIALPDAVCQELEELGRPHGIALPQEMKK